MKQQLIGIGNLDRQDDGVGQYVAHHLRQAGLSVDIEVTQGAGFSLLVIWDTYDKVIVIDAVKSNSQPGTLYQLNLIKDDFSDDVLCFSSDSFGLKETIELAKALNRLPDELSFYGISGEQFGYGSTLSKTVQQAADNLIIMLTKTLKS